MTEDKQVGDDGPSAFPNTGEAEEFATYTAFRVMRDQIGYGYAKAAEMLSISENKLRNLCHQFDDDKKGSDDE